MKKIIFAAAYFLCIASILTTVILLDNVYFSEASRQTKTAMSAQIEMIDAGINISGVSYLDSLKPSLDNFRITLIDAGGKILFDNERDYREMQNHENRSEIILAKQYGIGEALRASETTGKKTIYIAKLRDDGKIIRVAVSQNDRLVYPSKFMPLILLIVAAVSIVAFFAAKILTANIIRPINKIDLENPEDSVIYEELSPFLKRIKQQSEIVAAQLAKLQKRKSQFEIITANMQEGLLILDRENNILYCNKSANILLGNNAYKNIVGENVLLMCRNNTFRNAINQADEKIKQEYLFELNGKTIKTIANPIIVSGVKMGTAVLLVDVSEEADREKLRREFSANVSHELKTPLSVISGYSELISKSLVKPEDIEEIGKRIYTEAQLLLSLINDIIQLSNLDENGEFQFEKVNLFDYVESAIFLVKQKSSKFLDKNIKIDLFASEENKSIEISAIPRLLDEILFNILENAVKYNKENGKVEVTVSQKNNFAVVEIFDTGIGIPPAQKSRVFERFYRVDSSRSGRQNGTGLGLSIVKHAVMLHKGSVKLSSLEGEWTEVCVNFPLESI